jgi:hypothetical protein
MRDEPPVSPYDTPPADAYPSEPTSPVFESPKDPGDESVMSDPVAAEQPDDTGNTSEPGTREGILGAGANSSAGRVGGEGAGQRGAGGAGGGGGAAEAARQEVGSAGVKVDNPQDVPFWGS